MSKIDDGGSAFPTHDADPGTDPRSQILTGGLTIRDWFAGQALAGLPDHLRVMQTDHRIVIAEWAYGLADAMINARAKGGA